MSDKEMIIKNEFIVGCGCNGNYITNTTVTNK